MSTEVLTDAWFDEVTARLRAAAPDRVGAPDASAQVELVVSGTETGKVATRWVVEGGRLVAVRAATAEDPPAGVSAPQSADDLRAVVAGELEPAVAFMRGDLKPEGSAAAWFAFVSALNQPATRAALAG